MQPAGWYPDPSGVPQQFRFWDGQSWTAAVTMDPNAPFPGSQPPGPQGGPGTQPLGPGTQPLGGAGSSGVPGPDFGPGSGSSGNKLPLIIGVGVLVLALVGGGLFFVLRPDGERVGPSNPPNTAAPSTQPSQTPGGGNSDPVPGGDGPLQCTLGNGASMPVNPGMDAETAALIFTVPESYEWRFDATQFPYLNDVIAWGPDNTSGVIAGGLPREAGFGDQEKASRDVFECIPAGFEAGSGFPGFEVGETTQVNLGPHEAYQTTATTGEEEWTAYTVDTGQQGIWAVMITFAAADDQEGKAAIDEVTSSVK